MKTAITRPLAKALPARRLPQVLSLAACVLAPCLALGACARSAPTLSAHERYTGPTSESASTSKEREQVTITVYNQNFGLVREVRRVRTGKGRVSLEFRDVAAELQPETVHIAGLDDASALSVLEQNFRYDLLTPSTLLDKYIGKRVRVHRMNEKLGREEALDAEILSVDNGIPVLRIAGEVTYGVTGRIAFPAIPENLMAKPTLALLLGSDRTEQRVEVSYLTRNLNWLADYVLVVGEDDRKGDLTGWVTLSNTSGASYQNATLKLVAGDVQRVTPPPPPPPMPMASAAMAPAAPPQFRQESFFEYHLYSLQRPTTLLDREQKQVTLLEGHGVGLRKKLIFHGASHYFRGNYGQVVSNQKVGVYFDIENTDANQLGMPLPKGIVRVYKADSSGAKQFVGEDQIEHTPRDEELRIRLGEAFDVVGDRRQTEWTSSGGCAADSAWEVELRNHKDAAASVEVYEPAGAEWQLLSASHPHTKKDNHTFTFDVTVPARGVTKVTYKVRVRWC